MSRTFVLPLAFAAALVVAAPAHAQRVSLADRVAVLEQRAADNRGNVDLLNQLNELRTEVQALRAQIEELQQQNEQLRSTSRSQYLDLDGRLNRLEGGDAAPQPAAATAPAVTPAPSAPPPPVSTGNERGDYDVAFAALRSGDYVEASRLFQGFLQQHPGGNYAPNARYWLGESYYVTHNYAMAMEQFLALIAMHPTHDKTPGALLKVGLSQVGLREYADAEQTLGRVGMQYPGTDAAQIAEGHLRTLQLSRAR